MEAVLFKGLILAGMFVVWVVRKIRATAEQSKPSAMAAATPLPRRVRPRVRAAAPPPLAPSLAPASPVAPPPATSAPMGRLVVTRPAHASVHLDFRGPAALRRAFVAQEVLGPPLALRPPRL
jgi:hypothetical protein